jgi:hypothetical protein
MLKANDDYHYKTDSSSTAAGSSFTARRADGGCGCLSAQASALANEAQLQELLDGIIPHDTKLNVDGNCNCG